MNSLTPNFQNLVERLHRFRVHDKRVQLANGLVRFVCTSLAAILALVIIETLLRMNAAIRLALDIVFIT